MISEKIDMEKIDMDKIIDNSSPLLETGKFTIYQTLGSGSYGVVNHVILPGDQHFALKEIDLKKRDININNDEELFQELETVYREFYLMSKHLPNVIRSYLYNFNKETKIFRYTMDLMKGGDLEVIIKKKLL